MNRILGSLPKAHAGNNDDAVHDLPKRGGIERMIRTFSPFCTRSYTLISVSPIISWIGAVTYGASPGIS